MDVSKTLDKEYKKFKQNIQKNQNYSNCLNGESVNNNICMIGQNIVPCNNFNYDDYIQLSNESNIIRNVETKHNEPKNFNKSCKFRGTNQHFYINKLGYPNIDVDSEGYCIFSGTYIG